MSRSSLFFFLLLVVATDTCLAADEFGRFFTTHAQRERMEELRNVKPEEKVKVVEEDILVVKEGEEKEEVSVDALTVTETHLVLTAGMFGDFNPLHVNQQFAQRTRFGARVLHGLFTSALMAAPVGVYFSGTAVAFLEHACRFKAPVYAGDTLTTTWTIEAKIDKPRLNGGIAVMSAVCRNQDDVLVAESDGKVLLHNEVQ